MAEHRKGLFPALLKHWRGLRGLSQLDLALAADVSSRHVSFLETGRSTPSEAMILRLAAALDVPLRQVNAMLHAAGFDGAYPEPDASQLLSGEIAEALQMMKEHHDPFPLIVVDGRYDIVDLNAGALHLLGALMPSGQEPRRLNLARLTFHPAVARGLLVNFDEVGRAFLWRLQREVLSDPDDGPLRELLDEILAMDTVGDDWREVDLTVPASPAQVLHLQVGQKELKFVVTVTAFQAPHTVLLDELRIETWFPCDAATAQSCRELWAGGS